MLNLRFALLRPYLVWQNSCFVAQEDEKMKKYKVNGSMGETSWQNADNHSVIVFYHKQDSFFLILLIYNATLKKHFSYQVQLYWEESTKQFTTVDIEELTDSNHNAFDN
jgi:hypothetical protein